MSTRFTILIESCEDDFCNKYSNAYIRSILPECFDYAYCLPGDKILVYFKSYTDAVYFIPGFITKIHNVSQSCSVEIDFLSTHDGGGSFGYDGKYVGYDGNYWFSHVVPVEEGGSHEPHILEIYNEEQYETRSPEEIELVIKERLDLLEDE
jgi:hypothetical protein